MTRVEVRCEYVDKKISPDTCKSWGPEEEKNQADVYEKLFKICLDASNCELFEFKDAAEKWQAEEDRVHGALFDENG